MNIEFLLIKRIAEEIKIRGLQSQGEALVIDYIPIGEYLKDILLDPAVPLLVVKHKTWPENLIFTSEFFELTGIEKFFFTITINRIKGQPTVIPLHDETADNSKILSLLIDIRDLVNLKGDLHLYRFAS
jgi:hypothetical protein